MLTTHNQCIMLHKIILIMLIDLQANQKLSWMLLASTSSGTQPTPAFFPSLRHVGHVIPCTSVSGHGERDSMDLLVTQIQAQSQVCINPQYLLVHHRAAQQKGGKSLILFIMLVLWAKPSGLAPKIAPQIAHSLTPSPYEMREK